MINVPNKTMRSEFNIEQFRMVFQIIAHKLAIEAVTDPHGEVRVVIHGGRLDTVETDNHSIRFYMRHITYAARTRTQGAFFGFDVEEKEYATSNHSTKISFYAPEGKEKEWTEEIAQFVNKIMADAGIKSVPRFSLKENVAH